MKKKKTHTTLLEVVEEGNLVGNFEEGNFGR